jgi:hypothetical protein
MGGMRVIFTLLSDKVTYVGTAELAWKMAGSRTSGISHLLTQSSSISFQA